MIHNGLPNFFRFIRHIKYLLTHYWSFGRNNRKIKAFSTVSKRLWDRDLFWPLYNYTIFPSGIVQTPYQHCDFLLNEKIFIAFRMECTLLTMQHLTVKGLGYLWWNNFYTCNFPFWNCWTKVERIQRVIYFFFFNCTRIPEN